MKKTLLTFSLALALPAGLIFAQTQPPRPAATPPGAAAAAAKSDDCGCDAKTPQPDIYGTVNGIKISAKDIDDLIADQIKQMQTAVVDARKRQVDVLINTKLITAEAKKRGMTAEKFLQQEVLAKVKEPTEAEAQAFYEQNKSKIQGRYEEVRGELLTFLMTQRQDLEMRKVTERLRAANQVKTLVTPAAVTPPEREADRERLFATVNGEKITSGDVEDALRPLIFEVQEKIYEMRKTQLDIKMNDILLEQEAQKRKITSKSLLEAEISGKVKKPTEAEAKKFYDENIEKIPGTFAESKEQILKYLSQQEAQKAEDQFVGILRKGATVEVNLKEPEAPFYNIAVDDQPMKGGAAATVTIVEFTDFECPACSRSQPVIDEVVKEYGDRVRLVIRDYPLYTLHPNAMKAAEAAEAAREQGKYWEYTDLLFKNQQALAPTDLVEYARRLGLDLAKFQEAMNSGRLLPKVQRDMQDGDKIGVSSTPTLFINGRRLRDKSKESLKAAIEAAFKETAKR